MNTKLFLFSLLFSFSLIDILEIIFLTCTVHIQVHFQGDVCYSEVLKTSVSMKKVPILET